MIDVQKLAREAGFDVALFDINGPLVYEAEPKHVSMLIALVLEEAAKVCDEISIEAAKQWKERYRPFDQGREHGADECAEAIRSLKPE